MTQKSYAQVLVLQAANLAAVPLDTIYCISGQRPQKAQSFYRFKVAKDFTLNEAAFPLLARYQIDYAIVPDRAFSEIGFIISDMDSTFITIECVDEIAAYLGIKDKVAAITARAMRGEIDFATSLRQRVGLLRGTPETVLDDIYHNVLQLNAGATELLAACQRHQVPFLLVSGGFTFFTDRLMQDYGLSAAHANVLEVIDGKLTGALSSRIVDAQTKADLLKKYAQKWQVALADTLALGDGANDIPMLQLAGLGIAYHAKAKTIAAADSAIRYGGLDNVVALFRSE